MKFLVETLLPPPRAVWLREAGHEVAHVEDEDLREANDGAIWAHALRSGALIVTKDVDFAERSARETRVPVIVWLRVGNTTNRALRAWIEPRIAGIVQLVGQNNRLIEVI